MEKEVPENILGKIRKLIRLKESAIKIGSEGEAHAAAEAVNRLLTSYNLSLMDVAPEELAAFIKALRSSTAGTPDFMKKKEDEENECEEA